MSIIDLFKKDCPDQYEWLKNQPPNETPFLDFLLSPSPSSIINWKEVEECQKAAQQYFEKWKPGRPSKIAKEKRAKFWKEFHRVQPRMIFTTRMREDNAI